MDVGQVGSELIANPLAQVIMAVAGAFTSYRIYKNQNSGDTVTRANDSANVTALAAWKELMDGERAARQQAEARADKFAGERNEAMEAVWEMRGQLKSMTETMGHQAEQLERQAEQLRAQSVELAFLRDQLKTLQKGNDAHA